MFKKQTKNYSEKIKQYETYDLDVKLFIKYSNLNQRDYSDLISAWDAYYIKARQSDMAQNFYMAKEAFIKGNIALVKECAETAKEWLKNGKRMPTSSEEDPRIIARRSTVQSYQNIKNYGKEEKTPFEI